MSWGKRNKHLFVLDILPVDPLKGLCADPHQFHTVNSFLCLLENQPFLISQGYSRFRSSRCGLTLTLSTNLVVWMAAVTEESLHQTEIPDLDVNVSHKMYRGIEFVLNSDSLREK